MDLVADFKPMWMGSLFWIVLRALWHSEVNQLHCRIQLLCRCLCVAMRRRSKRPLLSLTRKHRTSHIEKLRLFSSFRKYKRLFNSYILTYITCWLELSSVLVGKLMLQHPHAELQQLQRRRLFWFLSTPSGSDVAVALLKSDALLSIHCCQKPQSPKLLAWRKR